MFERNPWRESIAGGRGKPPRFVVALMAGLIAGMVADSFVELHPYTSLLRLGPEVWEDGQLWRLVTYGFVGWGPVSMWTILQLVLVYWFSMELCVLVGVRRARLGVLAGVPVAGLVGALAQFLSDAVGGPACGFPFWLVQGQHILLALMIPTFATLNRYSTVSHTQYLFGLPIPSRWLVPLQLIVAFAGFAATRDLGGFVGIAAATIWGMRLART